MKPALPSRFIRSSRHVNAEPCRNCSHVYFGNYCNECGQEAYTGAPTTLGFIYEFLTRNLFERGKVHRTLWRLVRNPGGLTVDFLEGRRQRFIRPVRLYFVLSVMFFLLLSFQNSGMMKYFKAPAPAPAPTAQERAVAAAAEEPLLGKKKPSLVMGPLKINAEPGKKDESEQKTKPKFTVDPEFDEKWKDYRWWQEVKSRSQALMDLPEEERKQTLYRTVLNQAPKAMFFLVPVFALILKGLFVFRRIPYGAHLLFSFHYHCYVFLMLLLMLLPLPEIIIVIMSFSMAWYLIASMRTTYETGWISATLRSLVLAVIYYIVMALVFVAALVIGLMS